MAVAASAPSGSSSRYFCEVLAGRALLVQVERRHAQPEVRDREVGLRLDGLQQERLRVLDLLRVVGLDPLVVEHLGRVGVGLRELRPPLRRLRLVARLLRGVRHRAVELRQRRIEVERLLTVLERLRPVLLLVREHRQRLPALGQVRVLADRLQELRLRPRLVPGVQEVDALVEHGGCLFGGRGTRVAAGAAGSGTRLRRGLKLRVHDADVAHRDLLVGLRCDEALLLEPHVVGHRRVVDDRSVLPLLVRLHDGLEERQVGGRQRHGDALERSPRRVGHFSLQARLGSGKKDCREAERRQRRQNAGRLFHLILQVGEAQSPCRPICNEFYEIATILHDRSVVSSSTGDRNPDFDPLIPAAGRPAEPRLPPPGSGRPPPAGSPPGSRPSACTCPSA